MTQFILRKNLNIKSFENYISPAQKTNQFANYGSAVRLLEARARKMLQIDDSKAVIATSSGSSAHHAIIWGLQKTEQSAFRTMTQAFTFPSTAQGPSVMAIQCDFDPELNIHIDSLPKKSSPVALCVTNCFGHLQNLKHIESKLQDSMYLVYDNAATPYSFYEGKNCINYGVASFVSLHHTKPIGFGEGGLAIIDKKFEKTVRESVNFGMDEEKNFTELGSNCKMSEISAAAILQWWDQFDIDELAEQYRSNYYDLKYELRDENASSYPHYGDENFFPSCLPLIYLDASGKKDISDIDKKYDVAKYYKPLSERHIVSNDLYNRIICYGIANE